MSEQHDRAHPEIQLNIIQTGNETYLSLLYNPIADGVMADNLHTVMLQMNEGVCYCLRGILLHSR